MGLDRADRLAAVRAGFDDLDILVRLEAQLQALDGERLVVDQDRADGHFGSSVFDLVRNFDDNAEAPRYVRLGLEAMVCRHRPAPDGPECSPDRRRSTDPAACRLAHRAPGPVSETVIITRSPDASRLDRDVGAFLLRRDRIFDRILDQRLEQQRRQPRLAGGGIDVEMRPQPLLEAHLLDLEIELQRLDLLRDRDLAGRLVDQRVAQEGRQPRQHRVGAVGLLQQHQGRDRIQRVEQEVRVELVAQHRQLRARSPDARAVAAGRSAPRAADR